MNCNTMFSLFLVPIDKGPEFFLGEIAMIIGGFHDIMSVGWALIAPYPLCFSPLAVRAGVSKTTKKQSYQFRQSTIQYLAYVESLLNSLVISPYVAIEVIIILHGENCSLETVVNAFKWIQSRRGWMYLLGTTVQEIWAMIRGWSVSCHPQEFVDPISGNSVLESMYYTLVPTHGDCLSSQRTVK